MPRPRRSFAAGTSYHVTMRCNNQAFDIRRPQARKVILFCLSKAQAKFDFQLSGLCVMSNHVHYLIRPAQPTDDSTGAPPWPARGWIMPIMR